MACKLAEQELEETANKLADCWIFLDALARGEWDRIPQQEAQRILRQQQAPGWCDAARKKGGE